MSTDKEMVDASQVGYLSFLREARESLIGSGEEGPFTIKDLMNEAETQGLINSEDKKVLKNINEEVLDWKVVGIYDANDKNGFYSCVLETSNDNAIIAFRGSENMKDFDNLMDDWVQADVGLLFDTTEQHKETEEFLNQMKEKGLLEKYDTLEVTGHSLGGNLATNFGVLCAKEENEEIFNKITKLVDLDGPGFSKDYLEENKENIEKLKSSKVYRDCNWSFVGNLLSPISEENKEYLDVDEEKVDTLNSKEYNLREWIVRHDTRNLIFDKDGNAIRGEKDMHSKMLEEMSLNAEDLIKEGLPEFISKKVPDWVPKGIIDNVPGMISGLVGLAIDKKQGEKEDPYIMFEDNSLPEGDEKTKGFLEKLKTLIMNIVNGIDKVEKKINVNFTNKVGFKDVLEAAEKDKQYCISNINRGTTTFKEEKNKENYKDEIEELAMT